MKVKSITSSDFEDVVYNIGTTPDHNYYAEGCLVHNCYMDSTTSMYDNTKGSRFDAKHKVLHEFFANMDSNQRPFQVACLEENTLILSERGMIPIKDINIGDKVYNEEGTLVNVTNKIESIKRGVHLIGNKGFNITCTDDHNFMSNGKLVQAKDLKNKSIDLAKFKNNNIDYILDLLPYINKSSKTNKRGGSSGGRQLNDKITIMHTLSLIPRHIKLSKDIMWLYGLTIAEGFKRGISLHKKEMIMANRAVKIYSKMLNTNKQSNIRKNGENGITIEFFESKNYRTIFFEVMKINYGAKNKSLQFLYKLPNNLIKEAIIGMFDGDGCYRKRLDKRTNRLSYVASYKTSSKQLANELVHILSTRLNITSAISSGMNPRRNLDGRILEHSIYYMVEIYDIVQLKTIFYNKFKRKYPEFGKQKPNKYSHRKQEKRVIINNVIHSNKLYKFIDISLENKSSHLFTMSHGVITHNCGGGEPTLHRDFTSILTSFKKLDITPNFTTNGNDSYNNSIIAKELCGRVAVSAHVDNIEWIESYEHYVNAGVKTNIHIIISDKKSIDCFKWYHENLNDSVYYFVLLPYITQGRANRKEVDYDYFFKIYETLEDKSKVAFGAKFYPELLSRKIELSLYEPEIMSKFLDATTMTVKPSSFSV